MKKISIILLVVIAVSFAIAQEMQINPNPYREANLPETGEWAYQPTRPVPVWSFNNAPIMLLNSYYDYMIGSYNSTPLYVQPDPMYGGYFMTFHGKRTTTGNRRVFYSYINNGGIIETVGELTILNTNEGYPSLAVDPVSGKPIYAWHLNADADAQYEVQYAYDAYLFGGSGLISDPVTVINNPSVVLPPGTTDNEFIWPSVQIGPSPIAGHRRVYILARNAVSHVTNPCENVKIAYADFDADMLEFGDPLIWSYISIPTLDAWNHDTTTYRRPFFAFTVGNDGKLYYMGYHITYDASGSVVINEPDLDMFVCDNYGQGTWQRYTASSTVPSWNPPTMFGTGPGYFTNSSGVPYTNNELFWKITNSSHINAMFDPSGYVHSIGLWALHTSDNMVYSNLNVIKELRFNTTNNTFSINEVYPKAGSSNDNLIYQSWDSDGDFIVDNYIPASGDPEVVSDWNYPYWDSTAHSNAMAFHYNNFKITKPNAQGWMAAVWQNSWRAKEFNQNQNADYTQYATVPEIFISVSNDYGNNWSEPIVINSVDVAQFTGNRPMWVYPADIIQNIGMVNGYLTGKLALMFYHDNTWGAYSIDSPVGQNNGGYVKFMSLNIQMSNWNPSGISGHVKNSLTLQPISNATVSIGTTTSQTNTLGEYYFYTNPGTFTLAVSATGYHSQTIPNIAVNDGVVTYQEVLLVPSPRINITGLVQGGIPVQNLENANITITGISQYSGITNSNGIFTIANVIANQTYQYQISKEGYQAQTGQIVVTESDCDMGITYLYESILQPVSVTAQIQPGNNSVLVLWTAPPVRDNDTQSRLITKISSQNNRMITGYKIWRMANGQESQENLWVLIDQVTATQTSVVDTLWKYLQPGSYKYVVRTIYSGDIQSYPTLSYSCLRHVFGSISGMIYDLDNNVVANAIVTLHRVEPNGEGPYFGTSNNSGQFSISDIWYGDYNVLCASPGYCLSGQTQVHITENQNYISSFSLQDVIIAPVNAVANLTQNNTSVTINWELPEADNTRRFYGYKIWRLPSEAENNPALWTQLGNVILVTNYIDNAWSTLASGMYKYAVKAVYSGNYTSTAAFTNELEKTTANHLELDIVLQDKLISIYPNPMLDTAVVSYALVKAGSVTIDIYNINGQLVSTMKQKSSKGYNQAELKAVDNNGQLLPSGIYILRMNTGKVIVSQKLVVLK